MRADVSAFKILNIFSLQTCFPQKEREYTSQMLP